MSFLPWVVNKWICRCSTKHYIILLINLLWQDREVESRKAHNLEIGGSNPPPAIRGMYASGKLTESRSSLRFDSGRSTLIRLELSCLYTGGLCLRRIYA